MPFIDLLQVSLLIVHVAYTVDDGLRFHCLDNINDNALISNVSSFHKPETHTHTVDGAIQPEIELTLKLSFSIHLAWLLFLLLIVHFFFSSVYYIYSLV